MSVLIFTTTKVESCNNDCQKGHHLMSVLLYTTIVESCNDCQNGHHLMSVLLYTTTTKVEFCNNVGLVKTDTI